MRASLVHERLDLATLLLQARFAFPRCGTMHLADVEAARASCSTGSSLGVRRTSSPIPIRSTWRRCSTRSAPCSRRHDHGRVDRCRRRREDDRRPHAWRTSLPVPVRYLYMGVSTDSSNVMLPTTRIAQRIKRAPGRRLTPPAHRPTDPATEIALLARRRAVATSRAAARLGNGWPRSGIASGWPGDGSGAGSIVMFDRHFYRRLPRLRRRRRRRDRGRSACTASCSRAALPPSRPRRSISMRRRAVLLARKGEGTIEALERRRDEYRAIGGARPRLRRGRCDRTDRRGHRPGRRAIVARLPDAAERRERMAARRHVLVTDAGRGSAVAFIRSLGRARLAGRRRPIPTRRSAGFRSRYTTDRAALSPPGRTSPTPSSTRSRGAVTATGVDLVDPDHRRGRPAARRRAREFSGVTTLALPRRTALAQRRTTRARPSRSPSDWASRSPPRRVQSGRGRSRWRRRRTRLSGRRQARLVAAVPRGRHDRVLRSRLRQGSGRSAPPPHASRTGGLCAAAALARRAMASASSCSWTTAGRSPPSSTAGSTRFRRPAAQARCARASSWTPTCRPRRAPACRARLDRAGHGGVPARRRRRRQPDGDQRPRVGLAAAGRSAGMDFPGRLRGHAARWVAARRREPVATDYRRGVRARNLRLDLRWIGAVLVGRHRHDALPFPPRRAALTTAAASPTRASPTTC